MKKLLIGLLAAVGALALLALLLIMAVAFAMRGTPQRVPSRTILEVNLETRVLEEAPDDPLARVLGDTGPTVRDIVEALERAGNDNRVSGLVARIGSAGIGLAQAQEVRDAVLAFRAKKKFAVAFSETFGEFGPGTGAYYLASAFDQIWMQPSGDLTLTGIQLEAIFLRGLFDKLGIVPRFDHRYEYKNAMNQYTEKKFTPPHREATQKWLNSWFAQVTRGIAETRRLPEDKVRSIIDRAPLLGKEALDAGLVDGIAYRDEVYAKVKERGGKGAELLYLGPYLQRAGRPHEKGKTIALIYGVGPVVRGDGGYDPTSGASLMGSDKVAGAFRAAVDDKNVKAILFRIDSPGGSYVASDTIWRETVRAKKAGKPVIASMSDVAGSGGYFVAMAADKIVAQPATITASIGVLAGKMLTSGFWDKTGLSWDEVHAGQNAAMFSGTENFTPAEWARFQAWLDRIYDDFTSKVADGRRLPKQRVLEIAKGRIWTGEDAKNLGLIDELGGFPVALRLAKKAAGIAETESVRLQVFPRKKEPLEALMDKLLKREPDSSERQATAQILRLIQPVARELRPLIASPAEQVLAMPDYVNRR
jgi:protease-4